MIRNLIVVSILLVILVVSLFVFRENSSKKHSAYTELEVEKNLINIGQKSKGDSSIAIFTINNIGDDTLFVKDIVADCHCTVINPSNSFAVSGEQLKLRAVYDNSSTGFFQQSIMLYTNSIQSPTLLVMRGKVID